MVQINTELLQEGWFVFEFIDIIGKTSLLWRVHLLTLLTIALRWCDLLVTSSELLLTIRWIHGIAGTLILWRIYWTVHEVWRSRKISERLNINILS